MHFFLFFTFFATKRKVYSKKYKNYCSKATKHPFFGWKQNKYLSHILLKITYFTTYFANFYHIFMTYFGQNYHIFFRALVMKYPETSFISFILKIKGPIKFKNKNKENFADLDLTNFWIRYQKLWERKVNQNALNRSPNQRKARGWWARVYLMSGA